MKTFLIDDKGETFICFCLFSSISSHNMTLIYDNQWKRKFGEKSTTKLGQIVNHAQGIFYWPRLTTYVKLHVIDMQHWDENLNPRYHM